MSAFTGSLTMTHLDADEWQRWRLERPLYYEVGAVGSGQVIVVPPDFVTDGASVPRALWRFLPPFGRYARAAVLHDFLCDSLRKGTPHVLAPNRRVADGIFYEALRACGVDLLRRTIMWAAVRIASCL